MLKRPIYYRLHGEPTAAARIYDKKRNGCWSLSPDVLVTMAEMTQHLFFAYLSFVNFIFFFFFVYGADLHFFILLSCFVSVSVCLFINLYS